MLKSNENVYFEIVASSVALWKIKGDAGESVAFYRSESVTEVGSERLIRHVPRIMLSSIEQQIPDEGIFGTVLTGVGRMLSNHPLVPVFFSNIDRLDLTPLRPPSGSV